MTEKIRAVEFTYAGHPARGGDINQMFTEDIRNRLKPFVFLDHFYTDADRPWGFPYHPHSGVATFTYTQTADLRHIDTGGHEGVLKAGGVQWMAAGGGIWHEESYQPLHGSVHGLQLWLTLPPELENGPVHYQHADGSRLPVVDNTRVLAGTFADQSSPIETPVAFNYFDVQTARTWRFEPPDAHDVAWLYTYGGAAVVGGVEVLERHIAILEQSGTIEVSPLGEDTHFVVGTAAASPSPLVVGQFSIHSSQEALERGLTRIRELGQKLKAAGRI